MTLAALGARVGLTAATIAAIETGRQNVTLAKAREIAGIFDRPVEEVFDYVEVPA